MAIVEVWKDGKWIVSLDSTPLADMASLTPAQTAEALFIQKAYPVKDQVTGKNYKIIADNGTLGLEEL